MNAASGVQPAIPLERAAGVAEAVAELGALRPAAGVWTSAWRRFMRHRLALFGLAIVGLLALASLLAPWLTPYQPNRTNLSAMLVAPTPAHPLGTDELGRDMLTRILYGGRVSLEVAAGAALVALFVGIVLGSLAGYFGGFVDAVISRFTDLVMAFPLLLFLVMIGSLFSYGLTRWTFGGLLNQGVFQLILIIGLFTWFYPARIVRTQVQSLRHREFVEAAQMVGARDSRIMRTHLLPHVLPPLLAYGTLLIATNVMIEVGVTFLGAGIKLPTASWGSLLAQTWGSILNPNPYNPATTQPWLTLCPSIAIFLTVFALNQFGEGLREATDPRSIR
jgi:ABC-type dipeptide/oligopeptide/nickel transport system permease subunit